MSLSAHAQSIRGGQKMGNLSLVDTMVSDGLTDVFNGYHMGIALTTSQHVWGETNSPSVSQFATRLLPSEKAVRSTALLWRRFKQLTCRQPAAWGRQQGPISQAHC